MIAPLLFHLCASHIVRALLLGMPMDGLDEREEWLVGADSVKELRTETARGEARIDRIVLPKVRKRGGRTPNASCIAIFTCK